MHQAAIVRPDAFQVLLKAVANYADRSNARVRCAGAVKAR